MATEASRTLAPSRRLSLRRWVSAAEQGPLDYGARIWLKLLIGLVFVMLYAPILALIDHPDHTVTRVNLDDLDLWLSAYATGRGARGK